MCGQHITHLVREVDHRPLVHVLPRDLLEAAPLDDAEDLVEAASRLGEPGVHERAAHEIGLLFTD